MAHPWWFDVVMAATMIALAFTMILFAVSFVIFQFREQRDRREGK